ncbi:pectin lyase-like protein [Vararia minispora EC-137]|uniref:Pectin lyase-like protein n=1 Tax=Vararia minispora EC-137 TaxID=1314806 RepID=A0ACB8QCZ4_9AGAM|nr:pectin lyase-like protein [Vararia minispora EC-137]
MTVRTLLKFFVAGTLLIAAGASDCVLSPLGDGQDDTERVLAVVQECGNNGTITLREGNFNITSRKMQWDLFGTKVDLFGFLNFHPNVEYWLDFDNTYQVVFIQNQSSWFVVSGQDFIIDAHNIGGIQGNGQTWWNFFTNVTREDGDGRPIGLTLWGATNGTIRNFQIISPPFWCNCVSESQDVVYDGMICNATNMNPEFFGQVRPRIDTYRSSNVSLLNWDIVCGDDCLAIKGNSSNILANNITCRGGNGIAFGSLGQYSELIDMVFDVVISNAQMIRLNSSIQPNMGTGVYFKTWDGSANGAPPTGGGGGSGFVTNALLANISCVDVDLPTHMYQTNGGHSADLPSPLQFSNITWSNWTGTSTGAELVDIACSSTAPCVNLAFENFNVQPSGGDAEFKCGNADNVTGIRMFFADPPSASR